MAGKEDGKRPIIIKKIKKGGHGHHGGAWKVAYADFVTAMMAFFLLLWLLSSTSKETLEGLSEYFTPTQGIKDSEGIGFKGGSAPVSKGISKEAACSPAIVAGQTPSGVGPGNPDEQATAESDKEDNLFKQGGDAIHQAFNEDKYSDSISVTQTPEGLRIDITDSDTYAMFERGTAELSPHGQAILAKLSNLIKKMPNLMAIYGHTDASPIEAGRADYTNWELSADRAQSARRFLAKSGLEAERTKKVTGMAERELLIQKEPRAAKNRRIALVMLRGTHLLIPDAALPPKDEGAAAPAEAPPPATAPAEPAPAPAAAH